MHAAKFLILFFISCWYLVSFEEKTGGAMPTGALIMALMAIGGSLLLFFLSILKDMGAGSQRWKNRFTQWIPRL